MFELFFVFFKIGLFTFGGGYAMISQIKEVVVEKKGWITEEKLLEIIAIAESTPGPIAINMATYIGYTQKKVLGSIMATLGVVLPSMIIIFTISLFLDQFMANEYVQYAFVGIKCCVCFLILKAGMQLFKKSKKTVMSLCVTSVVFILMILFELFSISFSSIIFIIAGGLISLLAYSIKNYSKRGEVE